MILFFDVSRLSRSMTRAEWRKVHRWRRITQRRLAVEVERRLANLRTFGISHPEFAGEVGRIVNPPVMLYPPLGGEP